MAEVGFRLSGAASPGVDDPLGIWDVAESGVSFGVGESAPTEPVWQVQLPASPEQARAILAAKAHALTASEQALARAQREMFDMSNPAAPSFSALDSTPQDDLFAQKNALTATLGEFSSVSFGKPGSDAEDQDLGRQWQSLVEHTRQLVAHTARVQTHMGSSPVGLTAVNWKGDFETSWATGVDANARQTHRQSVQLALDSRIAKLRIVSVVATGAAGLALKAAVPGGQWLLLPAVWKFVRDVMQTLRQSDNQN